MNTMPTPQAWNPEDRGFWDRAGRAVAQRNLWVSIPALALAFAVWMLWSVVVVHLPAVGFRYSTNQLFWLTALPALCGATLRIFYAFAVPLIGGRRFTTLATASLPAALTTRPLRDPVCMRTVSLHWRQDRRLSPVSQRFVAEFTEAARKKARELGLDAA